MLGPLDTVFLSFSCLCVSPSLCFSLFFCLCPSLSLSLNVSLLFPSLCVPVLLCLSPGDSHAPFPLCSEPHSPPLLLRALYSRAPLSPGSRFQIPGETAWPPQVRCLTNQTRPCGSTASRAEKLLQKEEAKGGDGVRGLMQPIPACLLPILPSIQYWRCPHQAHPMATIPSPVSGSPAD